MKRHALLTLVGSSSSGSGSPQVNQENLLIWYDFTADDGNSTLTDLSGNDYHGTFGGGTNTAEISPTWVAAAGGRLDFGANNEDQIVRLPNTTELDGNPDFTVLVGVAQADLGGHSGPYWSIGIQGTNSKNMALALTGNDCRIWFWGANIDGTLNTVGTDTADYMFAMRHRNSDDLTEIVRIDGTYAISTEVTGTVTPDLTVDEATSFGQAHALMKIPDYTFASLRDIFSGNMWAFALWTDFKTNEVLSATAQAVVENHAPPDVSL